MGHRGRWRDEAWEWVGKKSRKLACISCIWQLGSVVWIGWRACLYGDLGREAVAGSQGEIGVLKLWGVVWKILAVGYLSVYCKLYSEPFG